MLKHDLQKVFNLFMFLILISFVALGCGGSSGGDTGDTGDTADPLVRTTLDGRVEGFPIETLAWAWGGFHMQHRLSMIFAGKRPNRLNRGTG
jgi:hypothetical protein